MAIHVLDEAKRCLNCKVPQCQKGCPIHTPIPQVIQLMLNGELDKAGWMLFENNPLTTVCSLVCNHENQCEGHCVLGKKGAPVHFSTIENYISSTYSSKMVKGPAPSNGIRVAIIGSGPAGLTIAVLLARKGYQVTIFEGKDKIGGVLRYGIPEFRLPKEIVQKEIDTLKDLGVEFVLNFVVGRSETIDELFADGYEAVFVGSGAGLPTFMGVPGENANGVYSANEYLTRINLMKAYKDDAPTPIFHAHKVAVVGGGNVAMDAARCAKRMGAEEVYIVYRRSEKELPARLEEIHHAKEEGIIFKFLTAPLEVLSDENYNVTGLKCQQMELGEPDESGRRRPVPVEGSEFTIDLDCVIAAIGTSPNPLIRHTTPGLDTNRKGCIIADDEHGITSKDGVFAGGDAVTGAATVILAMGAGKRAAAAMDEYIKNKQ